ncbi:MAG: NADP-dependent oxidoreductase [Chloroflexota bacterium]
MNAHGMTASSWAVQYHRYGTPDVLVRESVPVEHARANEIRVRVAAVGIHRLDLVYRAGTVRLHGFGFPKGTGVDFVGTVDEVGAVVTDTEIGAVVFGCIGVEPSRRRGTVAEFVTVSREKYAVLPIPVLEPALGALPLSGLTALACLRDSLHVSVGDRVLIVGAGGGVGIAAIQIARILGAVPVAVCGPSNVSLCRDLGAQEIYDYSVTKPADIPGRFAAMLDLVGTDTLAYRPLIASGGRILCTVGDAWLRMLPGAILKSPRIGIISVGPSRRNLEWLATEVGSGRLRPVVDRVYSVDAIAQAHSDAAHPHASGRRLVVVDHHEETTADHSTTVSTMLN